MHFSTLIVLGSLACVALADVEVTSPAAGKMMPAGVMRIAWKDSGQAPSLSDLTTYSINLCAGGNSGSDFLCTLAVLKTGGVFAQGSQASADIPAAAGGDSENGYFLQFVSTSSTGGTVTNYGPRFGMDGMTGKFTPEVKAGIEGVGKSSQGPPTVNDMTTGNDAGVAGPYGAPYTMQTGLTRYAPMQPQPPTKITQKTASPLYQTSSAPVAQTWLPPPSQLTTITQSQTFSVSSMENTASPLPNPSDDMQKFLNRWKD